MQPRVFVIPGVMRVWFDISVALEKEGKTLHVFEIPDKNKEEVIAEIETLLQNKLS